MATFDISNSKDAQNAKGISNAKSVPNMKNMLITGFVEIFFPHYPDKDALKKEINDKLPNEAQLFWKAVPFQPSYENGSLPADIFSYAFWDIAFHHKHGVKGKLLPHLFALKGKSDSEVDRVCFSDALQTLLVMEASQVPSKARPVYASAVGSFENLAFEDMARAYSDMH